MQAYVHSPFYNSVEKAKVYWESFKPPHEPRVLHTLGEGKNTKQIAEELHLSPHTVDTHRRKLLAKTNCVDTTALVTYCRMVGLM